MSTTMKLKNVLLITFLTLTLIPISITSLLLYKSGFGLSKESYTRNLIESINVQANYISQTIEENMISDYRFANRNDVLRNGTADPSDIQESNVLTAFQIYLESSADKITVCLLLDDKGAPIYTIGEEKALAVITGQLPELSGLTKQTVMEFKLVDGAYSLGIITPVHENGRYEGCLISVYDKSYIFKIISSYYEIADASTYICRENGEVTSYRGSPKGNRNVTTTEALRGQTFTEEGILDTKVNDVPVSGYYKNIHNSPWYLVGFIDDELIYSFTNQFVAGYIFIIIGVLIADILLSFYFSQRVVEPINGLIKVMEDYQNRLDSNELQYHEKNGYFETQYLRTKFLNLMKTILLVQHNFEGIYQLYQSSDMGDMNIDIDVKSQTVSSNKEGFQSVMDSLVLPPEACIVERFIRCFCEKDQVLLMAMFENMRDEHLSVTREAEIYTPHMGQKWFHSLVVPMYENDRLSRLFVQLRDISNFKKQELQSDENSKRDQLTGLYNRVGFVSRVEKITQVVGETDFHGLLFIDMDYFKLVNDNLGHSVGDDLLRTIGETLMDAIGPDDIASRFGGDEFVVFLPHTSPEAIETVKAEIARRLFYSYDTEKTSFVISASIGVSTWSSTSKDTLESLLRQADSDMYQAKREFKDRIV